MQSKLRSRLTKNQLFTIPNILSYVRIALIPVIVWLYIGKNEPRAAFVVILLSSLTDILDGFIARKFNMITDFGKMIDPVADKLTQGAILTCLASRVHLMLLPILIMAIKECASFIIRMKLFRSTGKVYGARWHGKVNTVLLYIVLCAHIVFPTFMQGILSTVSILLSSAMMVASFVLYTVECSRHSSGGKNKK